MAIVPGAAGEIGVLARHAPLIALLKAGSTRIYANRASEEVHEFATGPGFFTVQLDRATAPADTAGDAREIDPATADAQPPHRRAAPARTDRRASEAAR